jgi:predicted molibdopterin-dependent oxidoreductase YjgC
MRIDGKEIEFRKGETVFEAARRAGIVIPSLCWDPRLEPGGHCRLCVVNVKGRRLPAASCATPAEAGLEVVTDTPELRELRADLLGMVLSENPAGDCPRCRISGPCELHALAAKLGVARGGFAGRTSGAARPDPNPFIARDYDRCIDCYRCTRICGEVEGDHAIVPAGRGFDTRIATPFDRDLAESPCTFCGQCVQTCPTGALLDKKWREPATSAVKTTCPYCGTGCSLVLHARENRVVGVTPDLDGPANQGALCVKGQFAFDFLRRPERLKTPLIREGDGFREASWDEAFELIARRLPAYKGDAFYAIASGRAPNEAAYLLQKFARTRMGTHQVDNCARL